MKKALIVLLLLVVAAVAYAQISRDITITISAGLTADVVSAYAWEFGYRPIINDGSGNEIPNPETRGQFALRMLGQQAEDSARNTYKNYIIHLGTQSAIEQAEIDALGITVQ